MPLQEVVVTASTLAGPESLYAAFFDKFIPAAKDQGFFSKVIEVAPGDDETKVGWTREISLFGIHEQITATSGSDFIEYSIVKSGCISPGKDYKARIDFHLNQEGDSSLFQTEIIWKSTFDCSDFSARFIKPLLRSLYIDLIKQMDADAIILN